METCLTTQSDHYRRKKEPAGAHDIAS